jgi:hypothetical protein
LWLAFFFLPVDETARFARQDDATLRAVDMHVRLIDGYQRLLLARVKGLAARATHQRHLAKAALHIDVASRERKRPEHNQTPVAFFPNRL